MSRRHTPALLWASLKSLRTRVAHLESILRGGGGGDGGGGGGDGGGGEGTDPVYAHYTGPYQLPPGLSWIQFSNIIEDTHGAVTWPDGNLTFTAPEDGLYYVDAMISLEAPPTGLPEAAELTIDLTRTGDWFEKIRRLGADFEPNPQNRRRRFAAGSTVVPMMEGNEVSFLVHFDSAFPRDMDIFYTRNRVIIGKVGPMPRTYTMAF